MNMGDTLAILNEYNISARKLASVTAPFVTHMTWRRYLTSKPTSASSLAFIDDVVMAMRLADVKYPHLLKKDAVKTLQDIIKGTLT